MKRLNFRLILALAATALVFGLAVFFVQRWQVSNRAEGLLRRAELAEEAGEPQQAIVFLHRYLDQHPHNREVLTRLALLYEESTHVQRVEPQAYHRAQGWLEKAVRFDPDNAKLRRRTVDFYFRFRRFIDAVAHIEYLLGRSEEQSPDLQFLLAQAQIGSARIGKGTNQLEKLVGYSAAADQFDVTGALDSSNVQAYELLASVQRKHHSQPRLADRTMVQCVRANERSAQAYLARGRYLLRHYPLDAAQREQATADVRKAAHLSPDDPIAVSAAAEVELQVGNYEEAKTLADADIRDFPEHDNFYRLRANVAIRQNEPAAAMTYVEAGLEKAPDSRALLLTRAELDMARGNLKRVGETARQLQADERLNFLGDYLAAKVLHRQQQWNAASEALADVLPELTLQRPALRLEAYLTLAECYEKLNQPDRQREANGQVLRTHESLYRQGGGAAKILALTHFSEARAHLALGQIGEARRAIGVAKRTAAAAKFGIPAIDKWETALLAAEERQKPRETRDLASVERRFLAALDQRADTSPEQRAAMHARFLMQHEQLERAEKLLDVALAGAPRDPELLLAKVDLTQLTDGPQAASRLLAEAKTVLGDTIEVRLRAALLHVAAAGSETPAKLRALEEDVGHFSTSERLQLWQGLGVVFRNMGRSNEALRLWRRVAKARPDDLSIRLTMFDAAHASFDHAAMGAISKEIQKIDGTGGPYWKFVEARRLLVSIGNDGSDDTAGAARTLAREAQAERPNWHLCSLLLADLDLHEGKVSSAIEHLQTALKQGPPAPRTVRKLVELLSSQKRFDEALAAMERLGQVGEYSSQDARLLSRAELATGDINVAIALAQAAAKDSRQAADHLWLARLLARGGHSQQAIAAYRAAVELSPEDEQAWLLLLGHLVRSGRREAAAGALRDMKLRLPQHRADSSLGIAYRMLGENLLARQHFQQALAARPREPLALRDMAAFFLLTNKREQAIAHLDTLVELGVADDSTAAQHVAWARRTKARLVGGSGRYADFKEAVALLESSRQRSEPMSADDLIVLTDLTSPREDPLAARAAIEQFDQTAKRRTLSAIERVALARLCEAAGKWPRCEEIMTLLLAEEAENDAVVIAWCRMKLRRGETDGIESLLRKLDAEARGTIPLRLRLLALLGRPARAAKLVQDLVPPEDAENRAAVIASLARMLEESELFDEAEAFHRLLVRQHPELQLSLGEFLVRRGKIDEAFEICESELSVHTVIPITRIGIMGLTAERGELPADSPRYLQVETWLQRGLRDLPDSKTLAWHRVLLEELRGGYERVDSLYREYLSRGDLDFRERAIAANNLAMVLSSQGMCTEARRLIDEAIALVGPTVPMLDTRAVVALCAGEETSVTRAMEDLELAVAMNDDPVIRFHLALAREHLGDRDGARRALRQALADGLNPRKLSALERPRYDALAQTLEIDQQSRRTLQPSSVDVR